MRWKALAEIYTMHSFAQLCNLKILSKKGRIICKILVNFEKKIEKCKISRNFEN